MGLCNVKVVAQSGEPTENYHPIVQLLSALIQSIIILKSLFYKWEKRVISSYRFNALH